MSLFALALAVIYALPQPLSHESETELAERHYTTAYAIATAAQRATNEGLWRHEAADLVLLLGTVAWWESAFVARIQAGKCHSWECDVVKLPGGRVFHRAASYWQIQPIPLLEPGEWRTIVGLRHDRVSNAAWAAARILSRGERACGRVSGAIAWYARGRCQWSGAARRVLTYSRLYAELR